MKNLLISLFTITMLLLNTYVVAQTLDKKINNSASKSIIEISIIKNSESPLTSKEHEYYLKAVNNSNNNIDVLIIADNINCSGKVNVPFIQSIYVDKTGTEKNENSSRLSIQPNSSVDFFLKLINSPGNVLNSWNCTEVKAIGIKNEILSNSLLIESFIPNPKDFK